MVLPLFIEAVSGDKYYWTDIVKKISEKSRFNPFAQCNSPWEVYLQLITSLIIDEPVVLFDADFSEQELEEIGIEKYIGKEKKSYDSKNIPGVFNDFLEGLNNLQSWSVTLFTSGTTGQPKKITHNFQSITRGIRVSDKYRKHVWGWAYNSSHMAGIQVFFQALLNKNTLVSLFNKPKQDILFSLTKHQVSHLSATPTFYRMLLPIDKPIYNVQNITFGGERMDENLRIELEKKFPEAKFRNVYASTESGSLFSSEGAYFKVSDRFKDLIKIENNELCLHKKLLGKSEILSESDSWYKTGDLVDFSSDNPKLFKFLSRKNEMINVGGYKVNPYEVEEQLNAYDGVKKSIVYGKKNPVLGNIVLAEVETSNVDISEKNLRDYLERRLQPFKVPRMIKFVEEIKLTRTGKVSRKQ